MGKIKRADFSGGFPEKYSKVAGFSLIEEELNNLDEEGLKKVIVAAESSIEEQNQLKDADEALKETKEKMKALSGGYRDAVKYQNTKIKYALYCLDKMGKI